MHVYCKPNRCVCVCGPIAMRLDLLWYTPGAVVCLNRQGASHMSIIINITIIIMNSKYEESRFFNIFSPPSTGHRLC